VVVIGVAGAIAGVGTMLLAALVVCSRRKPADKQPRRSSVNGTFPAI
jgi:hypothetical protein